MKKNVLLFCIMIFWGYSTVSAGSTWTGTVLDIREGDIVIVQHPEKGGVTLMLYGVDAPDKGQPFFRRARKFLADLVAGKVVTVKEVSCALNVDTVVIVHEGVNINERMLESGYCWVYDKHCQEEFCSGWKSYEQQAREKKIGLWQDDNPVPPSEWRQRVMTKIFRIFLWIIPPWSD